MSPERMDAAIVAMTARRFGCLGVTGADGRLLGIITDGDLRRGLESGGAATLLARQAGQVMTRAPRTVRLETLAAEALHEMNTRAITALFVLDEEGHPVGILHIHDLLRAGVA